MSVSEQGKVISVVSLALEGESSFFGVTIYNKNIYRAISLQISDAEAHLNLFQHVLWSFMLKQINTASAAFLPAHGRNSRVASVSSSVAVHNLLSSWVAKR